MNSDEPEPLPEPVDGLQPSTARRSSAGQQLSAGPQSTTLLMVRHGESLANAESRFTLTDDEPLTALGVRQARSTGQRLAACYRPKAVYSSPFHRAHQTAREIGRPFQIEPSVVDVLYEQSFGDLQGRPYSDFFPAVAHVEGAERWSLAAPGGESLLQVAERVGPAVQKLAIRHPGETIAVVSHGGVMAALRGWVLGDFVSRPEPTENAWGFRLVVNVGESALAGPHPLL